jgi:hypothetical protein
MLGCDPGPRDRPPGPIVFILDSDVNVDFLAGRVAGLRNEDITHGSLVGRVFTSYCAVPPVFLTVEDPEGKVDTRLYLDALRRVLHYALADPTRRVVVNVSLASHQRDPEEEALVRDLAEAGVLVVAAAGNESSDSPAYPAAYDRAVAVASATRQGKSLHSNFGSHISLAASGDITFIDYEFLPYERLSREMEARGTSFAAPRVAAAVAYLLQHEPALSPHEAFAAVAAGAAPIADDYARRGLLGAGLLDIRRVKAISDPGYRFIHLVLPVCTWVVLGALAAYLCLRHGFVGVFASIVIWLVALPLSFVAIVELGNLLDFVGGGSLVVGLAAAAVLAVGWVGALAAQQWHAAKATVAAVVPSAAFVATASFTSRAPLPTVALAAGASALVLGLAVLWEGRTRVLLQQVRGRTSLADADSLIKLYRWTWDRRVRQEVTEALGRIGGDRAAHFLLFEPMALKRAVPALAQIALDDLSALHPVIERYASLRPAVQRRLTLALRRAANPDVIPIVRDVADRTLSAATVALLRALSGGPVDGDGAAL